MTRIGVMHITDTLDAGGMERVAVNLVNLLPRERYRPYLCTTRREGSLALSIAADVCRLTLGRSWRFDAFALWRLVTYVKEHDIKILHAHGSALFVTALTAMLPPLPVLVWHDHFGLSLDTRVAWPDRLLTRVARGVIAVSEPLADWSKQKLRVPPERVRYIPNFICEPLTTGDAPDLPGEKGKRIVCVANLRPQKDHLTLIQAMAVVVQKERSAHLLLVGASPDPRYRQVIEEQISALGLGRNVTLMGERQDVHLILRQCDIGVLSSVTEGLPLALIEYAMAALPTVATLVGQCAEVLDDGRTGILVPPSQPQRLADGLLSLLLAPLDRAELGKAFQQHARERYSADSAISQVCEVYDHALALSRRKN
jgi:glycosyltransferase involved in cell wall biosynthesis